MAGILCIKSKANIASAREVMHQREMEQWLSLVQFVS